MKREGDKRDGREMEGERVASLAIARRVVEVTRGVGTWRAMVRWKENLLFYLSSSPFLG